LPQISLAGPSRPQEATPATAEKGGSRAGEKAKDGGPGVLPAPDKQPA